MVIHRCTVVLAFVVIATVAFAQDEPAARGKLLFIRCQGCHAVIDPAAVVKRGPHLHGLFGRKPGSLPNYEYSEAMVAYGQDKVWNETTLTNFLHGPPKVVPGTKMEFSGIRNDGEVQAIIAYLATLDPDGMAAE